MCEYCTLRLVTARIDYVLTAHYCEMPQLTTGRRGRFTGDNRASSYVSAERCISHGNPSVVETTATFSSLVD